MLMKFVKNNNPCLKHIAESPFINTESISYYYHLQVQKLTQNWWGLKSITFCKLLLVFPNTCIYVGIESRTLQATFPVQFLLKSIISKANQSRFFVFVLLGERFFFFLFSFSSCFLVFCH